MRVLFLTTGCFDKGGISRYSRYQIAALRQILGPNSVQVLSLLGPDANQLEDDIAVDWHGRSKQLRPTHLDRLSFIARAMLLASFWSPHIVHAAHVNLAPLTTLAAQLSNGRSILNVYGLEIWSGLSERRRQHMAKIDRVIADCHFTAHYVKDNGLHQRLPETIWDPVDLDRFCPGPIEAAVLKRYAIPDPNTHLLVMSLGRLAKSAAHKGFDRLIDVVANIAPQIEHLKLIIAGSGNDQSRLEERAFQRGIAERVIFTGSIDEADLPAVYRCAHIFSLISDRGHGRGEGIPLTPLEAMACAVPIIVGNDDGSQEAVFGGRNGIVVSPHDPQAQADAILRLATQPQLARKMGAEARQVALEYFSFEHFVDKHRELINL